jgi:hypothetical protein
MTAYLQSKNRSVRFAKLKERIFEAFISNLEILAPSFTVIIFGLLFSAFILGVADYACRDTAQSIHQSLP